MNELLGGTADLARIGTRLKWALWEGKYLGWFKLLCQLKQPRRLSSALVVDLFQERPAKYN